LIGNIFLTKRAPSIRLILKQCVIKIDILLIDVKITSPYLDYLKVVFDKTLIKDLIKLIIALDELEIL
jgi:hypothetical protein